MIPGEDNFASLTICRVLISFRGPFFYKEIPIKFHEKVEFHLIPFT
jgi:hypothetical protein